jgi:hypothetical protein
MALDGAWLEAEARTAEIERQDTEAKRQGYQQGDDGEP